MRTHCKSFFPALLAALACAAPLAAEPSDLPLERVTLPPGFVIELVARVPNARGMTWGERGTLFVGSASAGKVYALTLTERDAFVRVVASGLKWAGPWRWPTNLFVLPAALRSVSSLEGLRAPWAGLAKAVPDLEIRETLLGGVFVALGTVGAARAAARPRR